MSNTKNKLVPDINMCNIERGGQLYCNPKSLMSNNLLANQETV